MWGLWTKAKSYSKLPSEIFGEANSIAAWMLDSAVTWFGITIENALSERVEVKMGTNVEYRPRYTLARLLSPSFKLPRPAIQQDGDPLNILKMWASKKRSGIKRYMYVPPSEKKEES